MKSTIEWKFQGIWIRKELFYYKGLTLLEKVILILVASYDNKQHCWASNKYIADQVGCSASKVNKTVAKLKSLGLVRLIKYDGRRRFLTITSKGDKLLSSPEPGQNVSF